MNRLASGRKFAAQLDCRKQLMEAWESAEWESREAQIRALQEAQLKEFEDTIKAKHAQVSWLSSYSENKVWTTRFKANHCARAANDTF